MIVFYFADPPPRPSLFLHFSSSEILLKPQFRGGQRNGDIGQNNVDYHLGHHSCASRLIK